MIAWTLVGHFHNWTHRHSLLYITIRSSTCEICKSDKPHLDHVKAVALPEQPASDDEETAPIAGNDIYDQNMVLDERGQQDIKDIQKTI